MFFNVLKRVKNTKTLLALIGHHTVPYHAASTEWTCRKGCPDV
jgi:hypothetical protein